MSVTTDAAVYRRELAKSRINCLPEAAIEKVLDFMAYQAYSLGINIDENDDEDVDIDPDDYPDTTAYLNAVPGFVESIREMEMLPDSEWKDIPEECFHV